MLKLNASFSKKVPAETEYSSQSYHAQIEIELPDGLTQQQLREKVHGVFEFVRSSVEAELQGNATAQQMQPQALQPVPQSPAPQANAAQQATTYRQKQYRNPNVAASPKQVNYLLSLAKRTGCTVQQILQRCHVASVDAIPSKTCSRLIEELSGAVA